MTLLLLFSVEEQNYELSPARPDNINSSLLFREQAIQTWMPNDPHSLFQIFYWELYRYLMKKRFCSQPMQKKKSWEMDTQQDDWIYPGTQTAT